MERENAMAYGGMEIQNIEPLRNSFQSSPWENSMDHNDPFESALSSMVSSPTAASTAAAADNIVLRELIGKLGTICNSNNNNSGEEVSVSLSPHTSCYNTPLSSPPKLHLSTMLMEHYGGGGGGGGALPFSTAGSHSHPSLAPLSADPGFAERAARYSCFANKGADGLNVHVGIHENSEPGNLSRVSSNHSLKVSGALFNGNHSAAEVGYSRENSSLSEQPPPPPPPPGNDHVISRKRKTVSRGKGNKDTSDKYPNSVSENHESSAKRSKSEDEEEDDDNKKEIKKENQKSSEPPKDYIHVRARRGQATDAHSLAERVRREKISQRMKLLQDLVPGCNKFLSMKLATMNPRTMDVNIDSLLSKDMFHQSHGCLPHGNYASDDTSATPFPFPFPFPFQSQQVLQTEMPLSMSHIDAATSRNNPSVQLPSLDSFSEAAASQASTLWEDDLQRVVFGQNQTQNLHGLMTSAQMKVEQ